MSTYLEPAVRLVPLSVAAEALGLSARYLRSLADKDAKPFDEDGLKIVQMSPRSKRFVRLADLEALAARLGIKLDPATLAKAF